MKHIYFVIYRLKSIIIYCCYLIFLLFINFFFTVSIYPEIEFIKPSDDVKIKRKTITFTKDRRNRTGFINKMINSGIMKMFIFFYNFYIYIFNFVSQVLCFDLNDYEFFSIWNIPLPRLMISFFFYLIIWWGIGIASESKLEVLKDDWLGSHNCFFFFFLYLIILFFFYSNNKYSGR
jgi:hypothetical protein